MRSSVRFVVSLLVCLFCLVAPARAARLISLSAPNGAPATGHVAFTVFGDNLGTANLRVWSVAEGAGAKRSLVYQAVLGARRGQPDVTFYAPLHEAGLYLAEARSGNATHSEFFRLVAPTVRGIHLVAPSMVIPTTSVPFTVSSSGFTLDTASVRVWRVVDGAARGQLVFEGSGRRQKREYGVTIRAPLRQAGLYFAEATSGALQSVAYLNVSDLGLVAKRAPGELLVYAVRLTTGRPLPGATIRVDDMGEQAYDPRKGREVWTRHPGPPRSGVTAGDGVAQFGNTPRAGAMRVVATAPDGSRAQTDAPLAEQQESDLRVLFYTERPIYRPGQRVFFKGIVRRDLTVTGERGTGGVAGSQYQPVRNYPVQIEITDATNRKMDTIAAHTNGMGSFAGQTDIGEDAPAGLYSVQMRLAPLAHKGEPELFYSRFNVQEYRKPEYEVTATPLLDPSRPYAVQGQDFEVRVEARYFFGGPVKGAKLVYSGAAQGETKLDDQGQATIKVANPQQLESNRQSGEDTTRDLHFEVTDESNRVAETDVSVAAPWSQVKPSLAFNRNVYTLGDQAQFEAITRDPIGRPVAARAMVRLYYFRKRVVKNPETLRRQEFVDQIEFWNTIVQTDALGRAHASFHVGRAGYIKAVISVKDALNRSETSETNFWVTTPSEHDYLGYEFPQINVLLDKVEVAPGGKVRALIVSDQPDATALITLQSDRVWMHRVIKLQGNATPFEFTFPIAAAPGAHLTAGVVHGSDWASASAYIKALDPAQRLDIQIKPSKPQYRPGETAVYSITTHDGLHRPQQAEVSLGFVDKAIYSIARDETPDPTDFFYGPRTDRVATTWFLPRELPGGSYQRIERPVPVRRKFADTAFWNPFVSTDAKGMATLRFPLPDNLTTWRGTARGVTLDTKTGIAMQDTVVTKPLLVRLELPRFLVQDDKVQAEVIVQNNTAKRQNLRVSLHSEGATVASAGDESGGAQSGSIPAGGSAKFFWTMNVPDVPVSQQAAFTATARGDATGFDDSTDAMQLAIPIKAHGVRVRTYAAGAVLDKPSAGATLKQPAQMVTNASRLDVFFSPSLAGPMLSALPELQGYPYGCTEQTLSRFVPAIAAARALGKLNRPLPDSMKDLPKQVKQGLITLLGYQHSDGGWGWWHEDDTDPFLTGYTVYGLGLAHEAGYEVDREVIVRGLRSIQEQFKQDERVRAKAGDAKPQGNDVALLIGPDTRAYMMMAYASAIGMAGVKPDELFTEDDFLDAVFAVRDKLSTYGLASLALAYARLERAERLQPKLIILGDEAALRYLYDRHKNLKTNGPTGRYFLAGRSRVYYRDPDGGQARMVTPPTQGIAVPEAEAQGYRTFKGFNVRPARKEFPGAKTRAANLNTLLTMLEGKSTKENTPGGPATWWPSTISDGGWRDSDIETTALATQAFVETRPNSPLILPALRWLMSQRRGDIWESTKDTAQVVITLADYLQDSPELAPDETVHVLVNGQEQKSVHFTAKDIGAPDQAIRLDGLNDDARIEVRHEGKGAVYFSTRLTAYTSAALDTPEDNGFQIERHYAIRNADGFWREITGPIPNSELVRVELRVTITKPREYVLLEDPIPAGFEAREPDDAKAWAQEMKVDPDCPCRNIVLDPPPGWAQFPVTRRETRDDRIALFASYLGGSPDNPGHYLARYILRPESLGSRTALPARIEAMYHPDINGRSGQNAVEVR